MTNMYYFNTKLEWHIYPEEAKNKSFTYSHHLDERKIANHNKRKVTESEFEPQKKWDPKNKNNYTKDKPMFDSNKENLTACVQAGNSFGSHNTTGKSLGIMENNRAEKQKPATGSNSIELGKRKGKQAKIKEELEVEKILIEMQEKFRIIELLLARRS